MFYIKTFWTKYNLLVAICDEELLGKTLRFKDVDVKISEKFYGGKVVGEKECIKLMERATIGNLIGEKIIKLALREGFITKKNILYINGIPHAQFVKL
ncbi:MAG TPA: DUF424 family protein [Candidatus Aenigmarchaeota archaeon]|nr:DUF424 family protein [Candidatus Aenigmarchaeota archaeon]